MQRGSTRHSRIQPQLRASQNSSNRRGVQARLPTSARVSRLRSRVLNQPRVAPSRTRNFRFPLEMDLDMVIFPLVRSSILLSIITDLWLSDTET